ncbi:hypothetical protein [Neobacillus dielmonensis]|uniref:hypothetical protein n=1 Tax=Neobacillus dielmonensis TaxID=1347369 RepID=UPI0005A8A6E4|nr:hypothetical protein [Neobacillus dielmonensis]
MKRLVLFVIGVFFLTACRSTPFGSHTIIDWVDFLKWDGKEYLGIYDGVLSDEKYIGEKVGTVKFKVADNVNNPSYKTKDGDAAFHPKGTEIYSINGYPNLLAVKSSSDLNGYRVYYSNDDMEYQWHYKDMPSNEVTRIEFYHLYTDEGTQKIAEFNQQEERQKLLQLLKDSQESPNFQPDTSQGDPLYYEMVFYTDRPIAYKYDLQFDGSTFFWHPWDTSILGDEIKTFIPDNPL